MRPTAAAVRAVLVLSCLAGAAAPPSQALSPTGSDDAWVDLAPTPDEAAKVDSTHRYRVYLEAIEPGGPEALWSVPLAGGAPTRLSGPPAPADRVWAFSISPDGRWVAFTASSGRGARRLFLVPIAGGSAGSSGSPRRIDHDGGSFADVGQFAFRSDSRALGFVRWPDAASIVLLGDPIFADGFESGSSSAWSDTTPNACPVPTGGPTLHSGSLPSNQTWTANAGPHVLTNNFLVPAGVTLTIEPCAEVRVRPGFDLTVQGMLNAVGTPLRRIAFRRDNPAQPWDSIWVRGGGLAWLGYVDVSGGGAAGASLLIEGFDTLPPPGLVLVDHVKVIGSAAYGVRLFRRAAFSVASRDLVVTGSGATDPTAPFPVRMSLNTVGSLPNGTYTGNASDRIQVVGEGGSAVEIDDTFHDRGVPYQIGGPAGAFGLIVVDGDPTLATLSIEPGVEMGFYSAGSNIGGLFVGTSGSPVATGRIVAQGTAEAPILFTGAGAAPVAGDWEGITFFGALAPGNVLDHVVIDAAGDNGGDAGFGCPPAAFPETSGALKIFSQPSAQFLTNSTISRSSTHGVFRAWTGAEVDFMAGNEFDDVAFCNQVLPKPPLPAVCPANPACPQ